MKKLLMLGVIAALVASSLAATAVAAKKTTITETKLFLHGKGPVKPVQEAYINENWLDDVWMTMDATEPTAAEPSSIFVTNYFRGPNTDCDGNGLLPVWKGDFARKFKGKVKVTLHTLATPVAPMVVSLYADPTGTCTSAGTPATPPSEAPKPVAQAQVEVAPGHALTEITFKKVKFKAIGSLALQLHIPTQTTPGQVRVLFDSFDYASSISLFSK
ncbi:MAG: hypothetical protein ABR575_09525 [Actinomycetota bacterium]